MDSLMGSSPTMNWESNDLEGSWKSFNQHVEFVFTGPLKSKTEAEKSAFLMIWVGDKGRNIFAT